MDATTLKHLQANVTKNKHQNVIFKCTGEVKYTQKIIVLRFQIMELQLSEFRHADRPTDRPTAELGNTASVKHPPEPTK